MDKLKQFAFDWSRFAHVMLANNGTFNSDLNLDGTIGMLTIYYAFGNKFDWSDVYKVWNSRLETMTEAAEHNLKVSTTRFLSKLIAKGFLTKEKDKVDKRKSHYEFTSKAFLLIRKLEKDF